MQSEPVKPYTDEELEEARRSLHQIFPELIPSLGRLFAVVDDDRRKLALAVEAMKEAEAEIYKMPKDASRGGLPKDKNADLAGQILFDAINAITTSNPGDGV